MSQDLPSSVAEQISSIEDILANIDAVKSPLFSKAVRIGMNIHTLSQMAEVSFDEEAVCQIFAHTLSCLEDLVEEADGSKNEFFSTIKLLIQAAEKADNAFRSSQT